MSANRAPLCSIPCCFGKLPNLQELLGVWVFGGRGGGLAWKSAVGGREAEKSCFTISLNAQDIDNTSQQKIMGFALLVFLQSQFMTQGEETCISIFFLYVVKQRHDRWDINVITVNNTNEVPMHLCMNDCSSFASLNQLHRGKIILPHPYTGSN